MEEERKRERAKKAKTKTYIIHLSPLQITRAPTPYTNKRPLQGKSERSLPSFSECTMSQGDQIVLVNEVKVRAVKGLIELEKSPFCDT